MKPYMYVGIKGVNKLLTPESVKVTIAAVNRAKPVLVFETAASYKLYYTLDIRWISVNFQYFICGEE